jgi:hypothetical protein
MKTISIICATAFLLAGAYYFLNREPTKHVGIQTTPATFLQPDLNILFEQDVSNSALCGGVRWVSAKVFQPYFDEVQRNITINFGVVRSASTGQLIQEYLPAARFVVPIQPDLSGMSAVIRRKLQSQYEQARKAYYKDSVDFFNDRIKRIAEFSHSVDSMIHRYKKHIAYETDIATTLFIAQKLFSYTGKDSCQNFILLNSDGKDSFHKHIRKISGLNATIILINSGAAIKTSLDDILTIKLQNPTQAIMYSLNK